MTYESDITHCTPLHCADYGDWEMEVWSAKGASKAEELATIVEKRKKDLRDERVSEDDINEYLAEYLGPFEGERIFETPGDVSDE